MYINITDSTNNKDVYITQSYRKENGKLLHVSIKSSVNTMNFWNSSPAMRRK